MSAPDRIYLQVPDDCDSFEDAERGEVSWCRDKINDGDIEYVRTPSPEPGAELLASIRDGYEKLPQAPWFKAAYEGRSLGGEDGWPLEEQILGAYVELFPNYAWTDARAAIDLLKAEVLATRAERDRLTAHSLVPGEDE